MTFEHPAWRLMKTHTLASLCAMYIVALTHIFVFFPTRAIIGVKLTTDPVKCGVTKMACLVYIHSDYFQFADVCLDVVFP